MTYFVTVAVAFLLELLVLALGITYRAELAEILHSELLAGLRQHLSATGGLALAWDHIQRQFDCCGVDSYRDWLAVRSGPNRPAVPEACCRPHVDSTECIQNPHPSNWRSTGCFEMIYIWFLERLHVLGLTALAVAFVQLFGLVSSMMLYCTIGYKRRRMYTYKSYDCTS
ncbi:tetraspanin-4-like [Pollicipes pollicipes]|uniref:tetraspanin-4-like n=1 Tax=Pollicipes pollicipes TaxID=41117 RepID=UPI001884C6AC|nr:tetraspanin-4-like [Pollicipes pollicipes]